MKNRFQQSYWKLRATFTSLFNQSISVVVTGQKNNSVSKVKVQKLKTEKQFVIQLYEQNEIKYRKKTSCRMLTIRERKLFFWLVVP